MNENPEVNRATELSWQRKRGPAEEAQLRAWLAQHPEAQADWELEERLNQALDRLPAAPVASNFTARVLQAAEREQAGKERSGASRWLHWRWQWRWVPRAALAALVLGAALCAFGRVQAARRAEMLRSVEAVSSVTSLPSPEVLKHFDVIRALSQTPPADEDLLHLLK